MDEQKAMSMIRGKPMSDPSLRIDALEKALREKMETLTGFGTPQKQADKLKSIFKKYDSDNSGVISFAEFERALNGLNFMDAGHIRGLFDRFDRDRTGSLEYEEFSLVFFGIRSTTAPPSPAQKSITAQLRAQILERGGSNGIRTIGRLFRQMDDSGNRMLNADEILWGLRDFGVDVSPQQIQEVLKVFDRNHDGNVDFEEFLVGIRGPMSARRRKLVLAAYDILDKTGDGRVTVEDLAGVYDPSQNPDVVNGRMTPEEALDTFLQQWDKTERDGIVTREEFLEYYKDVSASIDTDDYFELMIRNAWHISGGSGVFENTSNLRVLITYRDGTQKVVEVQDDLGLKRGDVAQTKARLRQQGEDTENIMKIEYA